MQERVPLNSAGDAAPLVNVNLYFITAQLILSLWHWKRKRAATYPHSWATKWKGVFSVFLDEMNCTLLVFVLNILSLVIVTSGEYEK